MGKICTECGFTLRYKFTERKTNQLKGRISTQLVRTIPLFPNIHVKYSKTSESRRQICRDKKENRGLDFSTLCVFAI
jgi:hypothetical protein